MNTPNNAGSNIFTNQLVSSNSVDKRPKTRELVKKKTNILLQKSLDLRLNENSEESDEGGPRQDSKIWQDMRSASRNDVLSMS
jgi:hypothetical protein